MAELTIDQKRALALSAARLRLEENAPTDSAPEASAPATPGRGGGLMPFLNRSIADLGGAPVDLVNFGLSKLGVPVSKEPFGGSASIENFLAKYGETIGAPIVPEVGQEAKTLPEYIGSGLGSAAGFLIPGLGLSRLAASSARPVVAAVGKQLANAPVAAPLSYMAAELASGAGSSAGKFAAEQAAPDSKLASFAGEFLGSLSPSVAMLAAKYSPTGIALRLGKGALAPFSESGSRVRAENRVQSLVADPEAAARAMETPSISGLTPAQRSGEKRLLALEKEVADTNAVKAQDLSDRAKAAKETLSNEARTLGGDPAKTRAFLEARRSQVGDSLTASVNQARTRAEERIAKLEPNASAEDASRVVRSEFDKAYDAARSQENRLWGEIPQDVQVNTAPLFERFAKLVDDTPVTGQDDIPAYARKFLGQGEAKQLEETVSPATLQRMRSKLLEMERLAYREGRRTEGSTIGKIADDVLETMNSVPDMPGPYAVARNFTRELNQTYREGPVKALILTTDSSSYVPEELTLSRLIGSGGVRGGVAERSIVAATGETPEVKAAIQDFLTRDLRGRVVTAEGRVKPEAAKSWVQSNETLLEQYPEIRQGLTDALAAQAQAKTREGFEKRISSEMRTPGGAPLGRFLEGNSDDAVARVFKAENPAEVAMSLVRTAKKDPSGDAYKGLRGAFVDNLLARARSVTTEGEVFSGSIILDAFKNPKQRGAFEAVLGPDDLKRLEQIGNEFLALERTRGNLPSVGGVVGDIPNRILDVAARVAGARVGRVIGGLQESAIMSARFRDWMRSLTRDRAEKLISRAVTDPELFATLMRGNRTVQQQDETTRRLQGWLAGPAGREFFNDESNESQQGANAVKNIYNSVMNPESNIVATRNLINSPQMRTRVGAVFENPAHAGLFTAALNREAQFFHRADQKNGMSWDQSLSSLVTNAVRNGNLSPSTAGRIEKLITSNNPTNLAAAVKALQNALQPKR